MNERNVMLLHYATGLGILVFGAIHIATVFLTAPVETNLEFDGAPFAVINVYRNIILALSLEGLLVCTSFHAFNGLRIILIELSPNKLFRKASSMLMIALGVAVTIYGSRTILLAHLLGVS